MRSHVRTSAAWMTLDGPKPHLNEVEEKDLAGFLKVTSSIGYGKTRKQIKAVAETVAGEKGMLRKEEYQIDGLDALLKDSHKSHCAREIAQLC